MRRGARATTRGIRTDNDPRPNSSPLPVFSPIPPPSVPHYPSTRISPSSSFAPPTPPLSLHLYARQTVRSRHIQGNGTRGRDGRHLRILQPFHTMSTNLPALPALSPTTDNSTHTLASHAHAREGSTNDHRAATVKRHKNSASKVPRGHHAPSHVHHRIEHATAT